MKYNIEKLRENQLVAAALIQIEPELRIVMAEKELVDMFVELPIDEARFAVLTWPTKDLNSQAFTELLSLIEPKIQDIEGVPLLVAFFDNQQGLMIDFLVSWSFGEFSINHNIEFKKLDYSNKDVFFDTIRRQDSQIRILKDEKIKVVKKIDLIKDRNGFNGKAQMVYLRDFTPTYKMNPKPVLNEIDRIKRNIEGHPQEEYPHDFLDDIVLKAVRVVYSEAVVVNSLLVTNSDYRGLLTYRNYYHDYAEFRFLPDINGIPVELFSKLGSIEGAKFSIDIFMRSRPNKNAFANEGFELRFPLEGWFDTLNQIVNQLQMMHSVKEMMHLE